VNLEERKIDFELVQQITHAGRAIRARAPRVAEKKSAPRPEAAEEVFGKHERESKGGDDGEQPRRRKKDKGKPSSYGKKPAKKSAGKPETKNTDKVKKKAKVKKKKANAKPKLD